MALLYLHGHLLKILECMKKNQVVNLLYQDFFDDEPCEILLEPYFVRVFHQRWYVIGVMLNAPEGEEPEERTKQGKGKKQNVAVLYAPLQSKNGLQKRAHK